MIGGVIWLAEAPAGAFDAGVLVSVLFRWMHVLSAAVAIGGVFFIRLVLPAASASLEESARQSLLGQARRWFKPVIHSCIALLLLSGVYNSIRLFPQYRVNSALLHGLWGVHILLAAGVFALALWLLSGSGMRKNHRAWMLLNLILLFVVVLIASALKTAREGAGAM